MTERTIRGALALVFACVALAACEDSNSPTTAPAAPSFDGGMGYGSGNRTQEEEDATTTTAGADSTGTSGMGYGSGN
jgi:hypothetical protein